MKNLEKIESYLNGDLSKEELAVFTRELKRNPDLVRQVKDKKVELMVIDRLERLELERQKERFQQIEKTFESQQVNKTIIIRRIYAGMAVAATILLLVWLGNQFLSPTLPTIEYVATWEKGDYNIKNFAFEPTIEVNQIVGNWETTIEQSDGTGLAISMSCQTDKIFSIKATLIINNLLQEGDNMTGRGTYSIEGNKLVLVLDMESIKNADTAFRPKTGVIEQWLKNNRLFREPLTLIRLTSEDLVVKYNQHKEGVLWQKIK